jgi:N-acyl-D-amino-acid deacylase
MRLWIRNGTVVDGTGASGRAANLLVEGDTIVAVGSAIVPEDAPATELLDATELVVAPGFIDLHSHSDITLIADPLVQCKLAQGITLELHGIVWVFVNGRPVLHEGRPTGEYPGVLLRQ